MGPAFRILFILTVLLTVPIRGQTVASYEGKIELPVDLYSGDGILLKKGKFDLEVRVEKGHHLLVFLGKGEIVAVVNGQPPLKETQESVLTVPVVGTHFLRSTAEPIGTEEERHYVKTGRPQYAEQSRDWKATLRVYKSVNAASENVSFIFQERSDDGEWTRIDFVLFLKKGGSDMASKSP